MRNKKNNKLAPQNDRGVLPFNEALWNFGHACVGQKKAVLRFRQTFWKKAIKSGKEW